MPHDLQLDLDVLLPGAHADDADRCVATLVDVLTGTAGVSQVHVVPPVGDEAAKVCLHLRPGETSVRSLERKARAVGAELSQQFGHATWRVRGIGHAVRAEAATATLARLPGVLDVVVAVGGAARLEYDRTTTAEPELRRAAAAAGIDVEVDEHEHEHDDHGHGDHDRGHDHAHGSGGELAVAVGAAVAYAAARVLGWTTGADGVVTGLDVAATLVLAVSVGRDVVATLRARRFDIDVLMFVAAAGAAALGHWSDAALLLVLFALGHALEGYAMGRARRAIEGLADLAPPVVRRRTRASNDTGTEEVAPEELVVGDVLVVGPNERIGADGVVVVGTSTVDESPVTGESIPADKVPQPPGADGTPFEHVERQHRVFAGTLNGPGLLEVRVVRPASDSTLARVVRLVAEADTQLSPTQHATQRIVRIFVPAALVLVAAVLVVPLASGSPFEESFLRAMAVLVATSPCALAIATPSAVLAAIARAAREGVLVKGGGPLEQLGRVRTMAFDKTGTLTRGRPDLVSVHPTDGIEARDLLAAALAVERRNDHPLARAVVEGAPTWAPELEVDEATEVVAVIGRGVTGRVGGDEVAVGSAALFDDVEVPPALAAVQAELERDGTTTMLVRRGGTFLGVLGVRDQPRPEAAEALRRLEQLGIRRAVVLSGDRPDVVASVAAHLGLAEGRGGLLPEEKLAAIRELAAADPHGVAMVGDGVNDAPAMAAATVGVAMGAAGSSIALETADIALMADRLDRLPFAVALARRASRVILQNLVFSLGVVAVLVPLTLAGVGIGPAVIAHEGSTLAVVANALFLLGHRDRATEGG